MLRKANCFQGAVMIVLIVTFLGLLLGCGTGGLTDATTASGTTTSTTTGTDSGTTQTAALIKLTASPVSVKSGNLETSTITATVLDASNAAVKNIQVTFSATGGQMSDVTALTDTTGKAQITFSSGTIDPSQRVVNISGTAPGISTPSTVPVTITGSSLTMSTDKTNITDSGSVIGALTVTAKDGSGAVIFDTPLTFEVSGTGGANLSTLSANTDPLGQVSLTVTGTAAGSVTVTARGLGTSATQAYIVSSPGSLFAITAPTDDPHSLSTNDNLTITVNAPGVTTVRFATTLGAFDGGPSQVVDKPVAANTASAIFLSSRAGLATVQVSDKDNPTTTDSLGIVISAPASAAAQITLQSSLSNVAPSAAGIQNTAKITATVRTTPASGAQVVGNAPVAFSILNPTGGGESVSPVVVFTDGQGRATTTFQSGTLSSDSQGVQIQASVVGAAPAIVATTKIVIGGTPGSVAIGRGSQVTIPNATTYSLPMSVTVADANGNAVQGRAVSLSLWPSQYSSGIWYDSDPDPTKATFVPYVSGNFTNEDANEDMYKNVGEDANLNGVLDPPNSAAGTVPATVTTDQFGVGNFSITYPKQSAVWIVARIRASVEVSGTETSSVMNLRLPAERTEAESGVLPNSSYPIGLKVAPGNTIPYKLPLFNGRATYGTSLNDPDAVSSVTVTTVGSTVTSATYNFTAAATATVGKKFNDSIFVQDSILGTFLVPVEIIIQ